jgi:hypothetical protein
LVGRQSDHCHGKDRPMKAGAIDFLPNCRTQGEETVAVGAGLL